MNNKPDLKIPAGWILTGCLLLCLLGLVFWFIFTGHAEQKIIRDLNEAAEADCVTVGLLPVDWAWIRPFNERLETVITDMPEQAVPLIRNHPRIEQLRLYGSSTLDLKDLGTLPKLQGLSLSMPVSGCENIAMQFPRVRKVRLHLDSQIAKTLADQPEEWRKHVEDLTFKSAHTLSHEERTTLRTAFPHAPPKWLH